MSLSRSAQVSPLPGTSLHPGARTSRRHDRRPGSGAPRRAWTSYLAHANLKAITDAGATPYIPFKCNSTADGSAAGKDSEAWRKMWLLYQLHREEFLEHYHQRSNSESTFSAVKRKFGSSVRSKKLAAQMNEVLAKVLCYNLSVITHSIYELGIAPRFGLLAN